MEIRFITHNKSSNHYEKLMSTKLMNYLRYLLVENHSGTTTNKV